MYVWYSKSFVIVKWNGCVSIPYQMFAGVRQGGALSPVLFAVYINNLIVALKKSDLGCHIGNTYIGILMYADDLLLISASLSNLQKND